METLFFVVILFIVLDIASFKAASSLESVTTSLMCLIEDTMVSKPR